MIGSIFQSLRFIPSGHDLPLYLDETKAHRKNISSPYEIFYNVYRPSTPFRKTSPPPEDFSLVVIEYVLFNKYPYTQLIAMEVHE